MTVSIYINAEGESAEVAAKVLRLAILGDAKSGQTIGDQTREAVMQAADTVLKGAAGPTSGATGGAPAGATGDAYIAHLVAKGTAAATMHLLFCPAPHSIEDIVRIAIEGAFAPGN